jgi:hypothetical protein
LSAQALWRPVAGAGGGVAAAGAMSAALRAIPAKIGSNQQLAATDLCGKNARTECTHVSLLSSRFESRMISDELDFVDDRRQRAWP